MTNTPIKLPTWGLLAQTALDVRDPPADWMFSKCDNGAAYKQLPLAPGQAKLATVALRHPVAGLWHGFLPRTLLFGAEAAVLRYNCFSRAVDLLPNLILGIPLLSYFDDFGSMALNN